MTVYSSADGTAIEGERWDDGAATHDLYFDDADHGRVAEDLRVGLGVIGGFETRWSGDVWWDVNGNGRIEEGEVAQMIDDIIVTTRPTPENGGGGAPVARPVPLPPGWNYGGGSDGGSGDNGDNEEEVNEKYYTVSVSVSPAGSAIVGGFGEYPASSSVPSMATLSAFPRQGYKFVGWTGGYSTTEPMFTVPVVGNMSFTAHLRPCYTDGKANPLPAMKLAPPVPSNIAGATYGMTRKRYDGSAKKHNGIDLAGAVGTPVFAQFDGTISSSPAYVNTQPDKVLINGKRGYPSGYTGDKNDGGNRIYIDSFFGRQIVKNGYMHLQAGNPFGINPRTGQPWKPGDLISAGEVIGYIGISGNSNPSVPHVHVQTMANGAWTNPATYMNATVSQTTTTITTPCN